MDLWGVQARNVCTKSLVGVAISRKRKSECYFNLTSRRYRARIPDVKLLSLYSRNGGVCCGQRRSPLFVCKASGSENNRSDKDDDPFFSSSGADGSRGSSSSGDGELLDISSGTGFLNRDWRDFRAHMIHAESKSRDGTTPSAEAKPLGLKWAHPLANPEKGCILIATEKLDGVHTFERTVVLLFSMGTSHPRDGPFGVVINRPVNRKIKEMRLSNNEVASTFADCSVHFGGPLDASILLVKAAENAKLPGFEEVIPGLFYGTRNSLDEACALVKKGALDPHDFTFFVGYSGWQLDQLRYEIELRYWHVAACSLDLFSSSESEGLWEDVLQLMGGHYSDLSRKPKHDA